MTASGAVEAGTTEADADRVCAALASAVRRDSAVEAGTHRGRRGPRLRRARERRAPRGAATAPRRGPQPVQALADHFDMRRPSLSEHLRVLRKAGLVSEQRSGRQRIWRLEAAPRQLAEVQD